MPDATERSWLAGLILALAIAAIVLIVLVFTGTDSSEQIKLASTCAALFVTTLTGLAASTQRTARPGLARAGMLVSATTFLLGLGVIWPSVPDQDLGKLVGTLFIASLANAHAALVLRLASRGGRTAQIATATAIGAGVAGILGVIMTLSTGDEAIIKTFGAVFVATLFGTAVGPIVSRLEHVDPVPPLVAEPETTGF